MAAGALASFGVAGVVFGHVGPPLLLASAGSAGLALLFASVANRPGRAEAFSTPTKVEPTPEIRWLEPVQDAGAAAVRSTHRWFGRHVGRRLPAYARPWRFAPPSPRTRLAGDLEVFGSRLRRLCDAGRLRLARALHRAATFVAPPRV